MSPVPHANSALFTSVIPNVNDFFGPYFARRLHALHQRAEQDDPGDAEADRQPPVRHPDALADIVGIVQHVLAVEGRKKTESENV